MRNLQSLSIGELRARANDKHINSSDPIGMDKITTIHRSKQPRRPHYIEEWAEVRGLSLADIARELEADKSVVSRWFSGTSPGLEYQARLAALFHLDDPEMLFRHPNEDWFARFMRRLTPDKRERAKEVLRAMFTHEAA